MITFGTDGWRGKIGDVFTDANLLVVAQAVADYLNDTQSGNNFVVIGYDNRFRSEEYADMVAEVFSSNGFETLLSLGAVSTPAVSFVTKRFKAKLGVCITASHNPPAYNGFKIKENFGGSALDSTIEAIQPYLYKTPPRTGNRNKITKISFTLEYFEHLKDVFDLTKIAAHFSSTPIHLNYMHGSASGYFGAVTRDAYLPIWEHCLNRDPLFGGNNPEPIPGNLKEFVSSVHKGVGFAFDGDGDRIAAVTPLRKFVSSSELMAVILPRLLKKYTANDAVFSISCSDLVVKLAASEGLNVNRCKIGFKHIAEKMLSSQSVLIGGEESGGIGFAGYLPERDGIASCLMVLEALAYSGLSLDDTLDDLIEEFGPHYQDRLDMYISIPKDRILVLKEDPGALRLKVKSINEIDGLKLILEDGSWLMFRQSGTEPVVRIYAESSSEARTKELIKIGQDYLKK